VTDGDRDVDLLILADGRRAAISNDRILRFSRRIDWPRNRLERAHF
jgi:hypothetical protein